MLKKIITSLILSFFLIPLSLFIRVWDSYAAWVVKIEWSSKIESVSLGKKPSNVISSINNSWFSLLWSIKTILLWVFVAYLVYAWAKMIMSMWTDEEKIKTAKRQIWYGLIWILFVNLPWTLYDAFYKSAQWWISTTTNWSANWINTIVWAWFWTFFKFIVWLLEILIFFIALFMFIFTWIKMILWWKDQKVVSDAKLKILYSLVALILVWFIEAWKSFAFDWNITEWIGVFSKLANLLLYIAPLIALFYLTLAWYYYITSAWDKEKVKKSKDIIIYILLWTLIFLASYSILLELNTFSF